MAEVDQVRAFIKGLKPHLQADCKHDPGVGPFKNSDRIIAHALSLELSQPARHVESHRGSDKQVHNKPGHADRSRNFDNKRKVSYNDYSRDGGSKKVKPNNASDPKRVYYAPESREYAYAAEKSMCLYFIEVGHRMRHCPARDKGLPATAVKVPQD